ncbi:18996_t:CDS:1, partial [Racocetra fulgida]
DREVEARRLHISEIMEKIHNKYHTAEKEGNANTANDFITQLDMLLSHVLGIQK